MCGTTEIERQEFNSNSKFLAVIRDDNRNVTVFTNGVQTLKAKEVVICSKCKEQANHQILEYIGKRTQLKEHLCDFHYYLKYSL